MLNPFDAAGYTAAHLTETVNILPNQWGLINGMGLFRASGVSTTTVIVERQLGTLNLLPSVPRGGPATKANRQNKDMRAFVIPHIPHDDEILPGDIQDIREVGTEQSLMRLATVMTERQERMRQKHALTLEYMRMSALKGVLKDGSGTTIYDWHAEFGLSRAEFNFLLGTTTTDVDAICHSILRYVEENLEGEVASGVMCLVGTAFFDKLIGHPKIREAYMHYQNANGQVLREDMRRRFVHRGIVFQEYIASFTLSNGTTVEKALEPSDGIFFPLGTTDTFRTYFAPGNFLDTVNIPGAEIYMRQVTRQDQRAIDVLSESNPLPLVRRPKLIGRVFTGN